MKNGMKRISAVLLAVVLTFTLSVVAFAADEGEFAGKTVILHSNDVHGTIEGYQYIAALKADFEAKGAKVILADAGDYSQGTAYVSTSKGASAITMMNTVGYDVATLGNHEFDYGYAQLVENMKAASFKVICSNVFAEDGSTIFDPSVVIENDGVKIAFVGIETPEAMTKANPALIKGLTFPAADELYTTVQGAVDAVKDADIVIALAHLGIDGESEPNTSYDLLAKVTGIDFLIDGHSHSTFEEGVNGEASQQTGTAFENIGVIVIDNAEKKIETNYLYPIYEEATDENGETISVVAADMQAKLDATDADEAVAAEAQKIIDAVDAEYGEVFAKSEVELNGEKAPSEEHPEAGNRTGETNNGDLICDAMLWKVLQDKDTLEVPEENVVAITNGGGIRAWIHKGDITKKDVNTVLPFGNTVAVVYVTGAELLEALEASTYCTPEAVGGFPQISGMEIEIAAYKEYKANAETYPGSTYYGPASIERVTIKSVGGKAFDPEAKYAVVTNNFCAAGGDTYYAFASATSQFDTGLPLDEVLMEYITTKLNGVVGSAYEAPYGRITVLTEEPEVTEAPDTDAPSDEPKAPQTGDAIVLVIAAMTVCAAAAVVTKKIHD